jgi:hypothetical protein
MKQNIKIPTSWKILWLLIIVSIITFSYSFIFGKNQVNKNITSQKTAITPTLVPLPTKKIIEPTTKLESKKSLGTVIIATPNPTGTIASTTTNQNSSSTNNQQNSIKVNLSINDGSSFSVEIPSGSNQCDVLTKAKSDGKISSLNMKYISDMGSYGIYQINGIGKENQVWWVYKVNGQSPSQGCDHVKANNNDSISWKYLGSK